jgi:hypothetical protein
MIVYINRSTKSVGLLSNAVSCGRVMQSVRYALVLLIAVRSTYIRSATVHTSEPLRQIMVPDTQRCNHMACLSTLLNG